jgi:hypothetical protein
MKTEIINLEEIVGEYLCDISIGKTMSYRLTRKTITIKKWTMDLKRQSSRRNTKS